MTPPYGPEGPEDGNRPDRLEDQLRRTLHDGRTDVDVDTFLSDVHRGARVRRRRRAMAGVATAVAVIAVGAYGVTTPGVFDSHSTPAASHTTPTLSGPSTSTGSASPTTEVVPENGRRALSLSATDSVHQYVLMAGPFGCRGACLKAYTTSDAGQDWREVSRLGLTPADPDPTARTAYGIRFVGDGTNGWVFGGGIRSTHDGGKSWAMPTMPADGIVTSLEAWGNQVFASVEDDATSTSTLVRSPVGEDAWQEVDPGVQLRLIQQIAVSRDGVAVLGSTTGLSRGNRILFSSDGRTWSTLSACAGGGWPSSVSTSADSLWIVCSHGKDATAYVSTDSGQSWDGVSGTFFAGSQVQARDERTAVVIDSNATGLDLVTADGPPQRILADQGDLLTIGFTNSTTGYVRTGDGGILRTVDSGATWQPYPLP
jgi:photosystem II stability/assembly factor-like uncharacterized protein